MKKDMDITKNADKTLHKKEDRLNLTTQKANSKTNDGLSASHLQVLCCTS